MIRVHQLLIINVSILLNVFQGSLTEVGDRVLAVIRRGSGKLKLDLVKLR